MALGKAVISTELGAEGINAIDNKEILLANSEQQFIEKIGHLIEDYDLFLKLSSRANIFAQENFDTFAQTKKLVAFYNTQL